MKTYLLIVGMLCNLLALWLAARRLQVFLYGKKTTGHIIRHHQNTMDDSTYFMPVVSFQDEHQQRYEFTAVAGHTFPKPLLGTTVPVRYLPTNPRIVYIETFLYMWAAPIALSVLGCVALTAWFK